MNAGPHYQKLYARVTHIWGNRKGQPSPSAMKGPHPERTASMLTFLRGASHKEYHYLHLIDGDCLTILRVFD